VVLVRNRPKRGLTAKTTACGSAAHDDRPARIDQSLGARLSLAAPFILGIPRGMRAWRQRTSRALTVSLKPIHCA